MCLQNMKYINLLILFLCAVSCHKQTEKKSISEFVPEYKLLVQFSETIKSKTGLTLFCYGINNDVRNATEPGKTYNFLTYYRLVKSKDDNVSLDEARALVVSVAESLLKEINSNEGIKGRLATHPLTSDDLYIVILFTDPIKVALGQGVASVLFRRGQIEYEGYKIKEYTGKYPAIGKHFDLHKETCAEAVALVKQQDRLMPL
jgi:hypothetical protein